MTCKDLACACFSIIRSLEFLLIIAAASEVRAPVSHDHRCPTSGNMPVGWIKSVFLFALVWWQPSVWYSVCMAFFRCFASVSILSHVCLLNVFTSSFDMLARCACSKMF